MHCAGSLAGVCYTKTKPKCLENPKFVSTCHLLSTTLEGWSINGFSVSHHGRITYMELSNKPADAGIALRNSILMPLNWELLPQDSLRF